jgi:integrase
MTIDDSATEYSASRRSLRAALRNARASSTLEQLGHTTLAMTQHYTKVVPQLMKDAAAAMDRALGS